MPILRRRRSMSITWLWLFWLYSCWFLVARSKYFFWALVSFFRCLSSSRRSVTSDRSCNRVLRIKFWCSFTYRYVLAVIWLVFVRPVSQNRSFISVKRRSRAYLFCGVYSGLMQKASTKVFWDFSSVILSKFWSIYWFGTNWELERSSILDWSRFLPMCSVLCPS